MDCLLPSLWRCLSVKVRLWWESSCVAKMNYYFSHSGTCWGGEWRILKGCVSTSIVSSEVWMQLFQYQFSLCINTPGSLWFSFPTVSWHIHCCSANIALYCPELNQHRCCCSKGTVHMHCYIYCFPYKGSTWAARPGKLRLTKSSGTGCKGWG